MIFIYNINLTILLFIFSLQEHLQNFIQYNKILLINNIINPLYNLKINIIKYLTSKNDDYIELSNKYIKMDLLIKTLIEENKIMTNKIYTIEENNNNLSDTINESINPTLNKVYLDYNIIQIKNNNIQENIIKHSDELNKLLLSSYDHSEELIKLNLLYLNNSNDLIKTTKTSSDQLNILNNILLEQSEKINLITITQSDELINIKNKLEELNNKNILLNNDDINLAPISSCEYNKLINQIINLEIKNHSINDQIINIETNITNINKEMDSLKNIHENYIINY